MLHPSDEPAPAAPVPPPAPVVDLPADPGAFGRAFDGAIGRLRLVLLLSPV